VQVKIESSIFICKKCLSICKRVIEHLEKCLEWSSEFQS